MITVQSNVAFEKKGIGNLENMQRWWEVVCKRSGMVITKQLWRKQEMQIRMRRQNSRSIGRDKLPLEEVWLCIREGELSRMGVSVLVFRLRSGLHFWGEPSTCSCSLCFGSLTKNGTNLRGVLQGGTCWTSATNGHSVGRTRSESISNIKLPNVCGGNAMSPAPAGLPCWSAHIVL